MYVWSINTDKRYFGDFGSYSGGFLGYWASKSAAYRAAAKLRADGYTGVVVKREENN